MRPVLVVLTLVALFVIATLASPATAAIRGGCATCLSAGSQCGAVPQFSMPTMDVPPMPARPSVTVKVEAEVKPVPAIRSARPSGRIHDEGVGRGRFLRWRMR